MSSITQPYNLHYWKTEVSHWCLKNRKFIAFIMWTHSHCRYTYKLQVSHKSFPSAQQLLWNFITYEAASARNLLSIFPCSITFRVLTSNFHADLTHSESISCHTTKPPSSDSSDFCSKTYISFAGSGLFYIFSSSVYEIIPMNLHILLHTMLLTSRLCKET